MKTRIASLSFVACLALPAGLLAHEGHTHKAMGTVAKVEKERLEVKATDGKTVSFALSDKTRVERGGAESKASALKVGDRVVVEYEEAGSTRAATKIRVGAPRTPGAAKP